MKMNFSCAWIAATKMLLSTVLMLLLTEMQCQGFVLPVQQQHQQFLTTTTKLLYGHHNRKEFLETYTSAIVAGTIFGSADNTQSPYGTFDSVPTLQIAEKIKELDFSLPSYDDIKSYKASTETVKSLSVETKPFDPTSISLRTSSSMATSPPTTSEETAPSTSSEPNPVLGSLLPSLSKKGYKEKKSYDGYEF